jgi:hypothetical protein
MACSDKGARPGQPERGRRTIHHLFGRRIGMGLIRISTPLALVAVAAFAAPPAVPTRTTFSSCSTVLGSQVCAWVVMKGKQAVELGATIPIAVVEAAPLDAAMLWPPAELADITLPPEAKAALGIDHLGINWEAHGHPPTPFLTPHFDFHFYNVSQDAVHAIDCADKTKPQTPPASYELPDITVPNMGTLVGLCVPHMGMHALAVRELSATAPFEASMLVGYYSGQPIFFEPMISQARLLEKSDFTLMVPAVANLPAGVRYPSEFRASYDAARKEYRLVFSGFPSK